VSALVTVEEFTRVMREADRAFEKVGGSTRHHVSDCLFPLLEREGMTVVRSKYSAAELGLMNAAPRLLAALKRALLTLEDEVERTRQSVADWPEDSNGPPTLAADEETLRLAREAIDQAEGRG
jgi:hypothetical protein